MRNSLNRCLVLCAFLALLISPVSAVAQGYKVEALNSPPPQQLTPSVQESLANAGIRVVGLNGPVCEIWLRKAVPAKASAPKELGILYGPLAEGTLVGAIRFASDVKDYRRQRVQAGVYTLRYALHPVDGNHMGVSPQRDFLLLVPAAADSEPTTIPATEVINLSRKASGTTHPAVWSLVSPEGAGGSVPSLVHNEEYDHWILYLELQLQPESGAPSKLAIALVVVGAAPEA